jgi:hypothetical protein
MRMPEMPMAFISGHLLNQIRSSRRQVVPPASLEANRQFTYASLDS